MDLAQLDAGFDIEPSRDINKGLFVTFFLFTDKDDEATKLEGRPIYKEYEYLRCIVAGDRNNTIERPATSYDRRRFAEQYRRFKAQEEQKPDGMPLSEWAQLSKAQSEELKYFHIHTVEQLAELPDHLGQKFPAFHSMKAKAAAFLVRLKEEAPLQKMQVELEQRDATIRSLTERLEKLEAQDKSSKK